MNEILQLFANKGYVDYEHSENEINFWKTDHFYFTDYILTIETSKRYGKKEKYIVYDIANGDTIYKGCNKDYCLRRIERYVVNR